jgi:diguanylate cyclase (GGDEF)-like protein/PAS domain S-box-containing protein
VLEWFQQWLNDPSFMPHGHCFLWSPPLLWLYLIGDSLIALAYFSIPLALWYFARKRRQLQYRWIVILFGVFIIACGVTHLIKIWNIWNHAYWLEAWVGLFTGLVSAACAIVLWPILPRALTLPSPHDLQEAFRSLSRRHQQLMESENRYRLLAETAGEGIWVVDSDGVTTYANQAMSEMLRCEGELVGRKLADFVFEEDIDEAQNNILRRLSGIRERHEFRFRRSDGTAVHTIVFASPVLNDNGTPIGSLKVVTDVSDLVATEHKLEQLNRELEQRVEDRTGALEISNRELAQEVVMREYMQQELRASNENLNRYLQELERQNEDINRLNVLSDQLHCCDTHTEILRVLERNCDELFKSEGGVLLDWRDEQLHQLGAPWGIGIDPAWVPAPHASLALRQGRLYPDSPEQQSVLPAARINDRYVVMAALQSRGNSIGALVLLRSQPFWSGETLVDDRFEQLLRALADHTALALNNLILREQLREQSLSDPLTGLYNRRYMVQQMAHLIALWERGGQSFSIILIDVDHFKSFNDRFGHDVGDEVLVSIADLLQAEVRKSDIACRMGGEEFVVVMAGASAELACARAEGLRKAVKSLKLSGVRDEVVTISAGVARFPEHGEDAFALMRAADKALYESKHSGRDRISLAAADGN